MEVHTGDVLDTFPIRLSWDLFRIYESTSTVHHLGQSVVLPPSQDEQPIVLNARVSRLLAQFRQQNVASVLEEAIVVGRTALGLFPLDHPERPVALSNLASGLHARFWQNGAVSDLEEVVDLSRAVLHLSPQGHPNRAMFLNNLAVSLCDQFNSLGALSDLDEGIRLYRAALELCPTDHSKRPTTLNHLAASLCARFKHLRVQHDLDEAVALGQEALDLHSRSDPGRPGALNNLATSYNMRSIHLRNLADLNHAIGLHREALEQSGPRHPHLSIFYANLATCLEARFDEQGAMADLDEAITLLRAALDLHSRGHPQCATSLKDLGSALHARFKQMGQNSGVGDLNEAILLLQASLELRPKGHLERPVFLDKVADCVQSRFGRWRNISDLDKVIALRREALSLCPPGYRGRSLYLNKLATCLRGRFKLQGVMADLDASIALHREALDLRTPGHPGRSMSLGSLAKSLRLRFMHQGVTSDLDEAIIFEQMLEREAENVLPTHLLGRSRGRSATLDSVASSHSHIDPTKIRQVISDIVLSTLANVPTRLIETGTGMLHDRTALVNTFEHSPQYEELLASLSSYRPTEQIECIRAAVQTYFQYATLSHRWGMEEPLLRDVDVHNIYEITVLSEGLIKLQNFCRAAAAKGYLWTWSDTCCINKESSAELQEAIGSMFSWYRQSALTIVHLSDVLDAPSNAGALSRSVWLKRGWTLQELLAPRTMLFYLQDWSLYMNPLSSNHKEDSGIVDELARATGISPQHLTSFCPGIDDARSKLQWASVRRTTVQEDAAYSLFGIFDLQLPVMYGERRERALGRLLQEIVAQSGDVSVLDWAGKQSSFHSCLPAGLDAYQTLSYTPTSLTDSELESSIVKLRKVITPEAACKLYNSLASLVPARFSNRRLTVPCIVYPVRSVTPKHSSPDLYDVQVSGLKPLRITSSDHLDEGKDAAAPRYILVRIWNRKWLDPLCQDTTAAAFKLMVWLAQPFSTFLLAQLPHGEFKRIASRHSIIARIDQVSSLPDSQIRTLEIL